MQCEAHGLCMRCVRQTVGVVRVEQWSLSAMLHLLVADAGTGTDADGCTFTAAT